MPFKKLIVALAVLASIAGIFYACKSLKSTTGSSGKKPRVLVFSKTSGYHHASITEGQPSIYKLGQENNFLVDTTSDASLFIEDSLKNYAAVVFLNTTQNVLNADQQVAFERFIQAGGGFVGIHAAADTEYDWPWYNKLVGAYFLDHPGINDHYPNVQPAVLNVVDTTHISTQGLSKEWKRVDEYYNYKNINPDIRTLIMIDESSYRGGRLGDEHPIAWYHNFDGGRAFYTGLGHTKESFSEPLFLKHLLGGIKYAIGEKVTLDYAKAYSVKAPEDNRFTKTVLVNDLNEPMELAVAPDGRVFFTERAGKFYMYNPATQKTVLLRDFPAKAVDKYLNGLIGVTLDPNFKTNNQLYVFYTSATGEQHHQNVSRFTLTPDNTLDTTTEKIIIKIPIDLEVSAHTGGSLAWDKNNNLYISTGDNTVPFESHGYAPMDERPGRLVYDAQRSAGNANDLRGKILRIHPEPDGTYTIPEGNLFPKGTEGTRPEIYVMGCRNPYRISVDQATSILYWGEVGPDAGTDSRHGPRGYDEFNQAKKPGNYGWPYFVGNSKAYNDSDFATKEIGPLFELTGATNNSPNNTGIKKLPPPQSAMVWYPYSRSDEFPDLGTGGRCAMGGPVYHFDQNLSSATKIPAYFDKSLFVYDWMRNWVFAVRLDENNNYKRLEQFMPTNGDFRRPVDMEIGPEGSIYMLEYGSVYGIDNADARLVRIDYNAGNRAPIARITTRDTVGLAPLKATLSGRRSLDYDEEDKLSYEWYVNGNKVSNEVQPSYTFTNNGIYTTVLKVTDPAGKSDFDTVSVKVGNTLPKVAIQTANNSSFFFPKTTAVNYAVNIADNEDKEIDPQGLKIQMRYIPKVASTQELIGHQLTEDYNLGKTLIASSDCKACHQLNAKSVGPSFMDVSKKYAGDQSNISRLANKIITGGGGVWGEHAMNAHPQLSKEDATEIVKYVLSVSLEPQEVALPQSGAIVLKEHIGGTDQGRYILSASYTDKGGAAAPLTSKDLLVLRPARVRAGEADVFYNVQRRQQAISRMHKGSYFVLKGINLNEISKLTYRYAAIKSAGIEVRLDSLEGKVVSTFNYSPTGAFNKWVEDSTAITNPGGRHNLFFVAVSKDTAKRDLAAIDWIRFEGGTEVTEKTVPEQKTAPQKPAVEKKTEKTKPAVKQASVVGSSIGRALVAKSDCGVCHKPNDRLVGPAYAAIAQKYKGKPAAVEMLAMKVINGGAGNWGQVPMTPHPQLSKKDAIEMVKFVLSGTK